MLVLFETAGADFDSAAGGQSGPLEIGLLAALADRVILGRSDAVTVTAGDHTPFAAEWTDFHKISVLTLKMLS